MERPLVTVSIITYNSSDTVLATLDSIYSQIYPNIELVISDDCSTDNTIELCKQWLLINNTRFDNCRIIQSEKNTGVTANCNRAISTIKGSYLKLLAGDDLLLPNAISDYVDYMMDNPLAVYVFSRVVVFGGSEEVVREFTETVFDYSFFALSHEEQKRWFLGRWTNPIPAASAFVNVENAISNGVFFYDESIPMLEDWPKWLELIKKDIEFCFIDKPLACYRVGCDSSVSVGSEHKDSFTKSRILLYKRYLFQPTMKLYGLGAALLAFTKKMASINRYSIWSFLFQSLSLLRMLRNSVVNLVLKYIKIGHRL